MARPAFVVQHLVFCTSVEYPDVRRPQRNSTLGGVDYVFEFPPATEFPFEPDEFWLHARLFSVADRPFDTRPLFVTCVWRSHPQRRGNRHLDAHAGADHVPAARRCSRPQLGVPEHGE